MSPHPSYDSDEGEANRYADPSVLTWFLGGVIALASLTLSGLGYLAWRWLTK